MPVKELSIEESTQSTQSTQVFHSILVATDFSPASRRALSGALSLAVTNDADVSLVHVFHTDWRYEMLESPPEIDLERTDAQQKLDAEVRAVHSTREIHPILIQQQLVAQSILMALAQSHADLLVVGTRARTGLLKIVLGSVAEELLRSAPCPVMSIGPKSTMSSRIKTILFATDFGAGSIKALPTVSNLAQGQKANLILLHMLPLMPATSTSLSAYSPANAGAEALEDWDSSLRKLSLQQLREWATSAASLQPEPKYVVGIDLLPEGILTAAARFRADLIVMGANRRTSGRVTAHLPWTAVHHVIHDAPCPVLTVAG
jgi:nucleotide-binding universal stress UspA family protein